MDAHKLAPGLYEYRGYRLETRSNHTGVWYEIRETGESYNSLQRTLQAVDRRLSEQKRYERFR